MLDVSENTKEKLLSSQNMSPELYQFQVPFYIFLRFLTVPNHSYNPPPQKKNTSMLIWNSPCLDLKAQIPMDASVKREAKACRKLTNWRFRGPRCSWLIKLDACFSLFFYHFYFTLLGSSSWHLCFEYYLWPKVLIFQYEMQEGN